MRPLTPCEGTKPLLGELDLPPLGESIVDDCCDEATRGRRDDVVDRVEVDVLEYAKVMRQANI